MPPELRCSGHRRHRSCTVAAATPPELLCSGCRCRRSGYSAGVDAAGAAMQRPPASLELLCNGRRSCDAVVVDAAGGVARQHQPSELRKMPRRASRRVADAATRPPLHQPCCCIEAAETDASSLVAPVLQCRITGGDQRCHGVCLDKAHTQQHDPPYISGVIAKSSSNNRHARQSSRDNTGGAGKHHRRRRPTTCSRRAGVALERQNPPRRAASQRPQLAAV